jgi:hypothetical protein
MSIGSSSGNSVATSLITTGAIAIGTTNPSRELDVVGVIQAQGSFISLVSSSSTNLATSNGGNVKLTNSSATDGNFNNIGGYNSNGLVTSQINFINVSQASRTGDISFNTHNGSSLSERMRIDSSGNVGIGVSPSVKLHIIDSSNPDNTSGSVIIEGRRDGVANTLTLRAKDASAPTSALPNGQGSVLRWQGFDGTDFENMGYILVSADGQAVADGDAPSFMAFGTSADGSSNPTERMRIDSSGSLLLAGLTDSTPNSEGAAGYLVTSADGSLFSILSAANNTATRGHIAFSNPNGIVGQITTNASATAYLTSSDYRLKENVVEMTGALDRVDQLKPSRFNFIADADTTVDGFLAHEVADVVPEAISGEKDATEEYEVTPAVLDDEGNVIEEAVMGTRPVYQGIDQSKLVPLLVGAIQELRAEIEQLKAQ